MKKKPISPLGCKACTHAWIDRCALTGKKHPWPVNAKHHCPEFKRAPGEASK